MRKLTAATIAIALIGATGAHAQQWTYDNAFGQTMTSNPYVQPCCAYSPPYHTGTEQPMWSDPPSPNYQADREFQYYQNSIPPRGDGIELRPGGGR